MCLGRGSVPSARAPGQARLGQSNSDSARLRLVPAWASARGQARPRQVTHMRWRERGDKITFHTKMSLALHLRTHPHRPCEGVPERVMPGRGVGLRHRQGKRSPETAEGAAPGHSTVVTATVDLWIEEDGVDRGRSETDVSVGH